MPDTEDSYESVLIMPPDFPYKKLLHISEILEREEVFVLGYIPPSEGPYLPDGFMREAWVDGVKTTLLPDRNVVSRLAQVAKGEPIDVDHQRRLAAAILAFSQCLDILIEPSVAFHELAPSKGNHFAYDELAWFRVADNGNVHDWVAAALGEVNHIQVSGDPSPIKQMDLAKPLARWRRNYVVALKIGELELTSSSHLDRVLALLQWMYQDFILAGPAAMLACIYFAPNSPPRQGLMKHLRSPNRDKAINGAKNAAWDITHLSDFARRINEEPQSRFILATFDGGLRAVARLLYESHCVDAMAMALQAWWPAQDANRIAEVLFNYMGRARSPEWRKQQQERPNYIGELIERGEASLRGWPL